VQVQHCLPHQDLQQCVVYASDVVMERQQRRDVSVEGVGDDTHEREREQVAGYNEVA
ncbi:unnamed protein product, partial [Musa textilis]